MRQYVVDAFTDRVFGGNPAAIIVSDEELPEDLMQSIAIENNLSETAYAVPDGDVWHLRWFTPGGEIDLCGHATLATSHVILGILHPDLDEVRYETMSGELVVRKRDGVYELDLPRFDLARIEVTDTMEDAIGSRPVEAWMGRDLLCVMDSEETVRNASVDMKKVEELDGLLLHLTARGRDFDCVSRTYAPKLAVPEDPVCGSGHCHIVPYWSEVLGKESILAYQASRRGGTLRGRVEGDRVVLGGSAVLYSEAEIRVRRGPSR